MNIAIIGSNCLVEYLIQRMADHTVYTYDLPEYMCSSPNVINTPMVGDYREFWINEASKMKEKHIDLIIATNLIPQLWRELHYALKNNGIPMLIPSPEAALMEWSKVESKVLFHNIGIPTPAFEVLSYDEVLAGFKRFERPYVLKYDREYREGLQTIVVTDNNVEEQYDHFVQHGRTKISSGLSQKENTAFIKEQFVAGKEYSYHLLCNGTECTFMGAARDYKKRYEGDVGHNTVGMGAYSPVDYADHIIEGYAKKIIAHLNKIGIQYVGVMYIGVLVDENNNHLVLEVNTRFGDPEFCAILPTIDSDIVQSFMDAATGKKMAPFKFNDNKSLSLRLVHKNYTLFEKLDVKLPVLDECPGVAIAHSGGYSNFGPMVTTAQDTIMKSADKLHEYIKHSDLGDFTYRKDVGYFK